MGDCQLTNQFGSSPLIYLYKNKLVCVSHIWLPVQWHVIMLEDENYYNN